MAAREASYLEAMGGAPPDPDDDAGASAGAPPAEGGAEFWARQYHWNRVKDDATGDNVHPIDRAPYLDPVAVWERISYGWVSPLMARAQKTVLGPDDMLPLPTRDTAEVTARVPDRCSRTHFAARHPPPPLSPPHPSPRSPRC